MKDSIVVATVQMAPKPLDRKANLEYMTNAVIKASTEMNADLIVFPELSNIGYITGRNKEFGRKYIKNAEKIPGPTTDGLGKVAKKLGVYIVVGLTELHPEITATIYNSAALIGPKEGVIGVHRKVHIPGEEKHYFMAGSNLDVFSTDIGTLGIAICYDGQFPELVRIMAIKGAEVICMLWNMPFFSNPPTLLHNLTATRAAENRFYAVSCNRIGTDDGEVEFFGHSCIVDPVGNFLAKSDDAEETILVATLNNDILYEERAQQPVFCDRRPELYSQLSKI